MARGITLTMLTGGGIPSGPELGWFWPRAHSEYLIGMESTSSWGNLEELSRAAPSPQWVKRHLRSDNREGQLHFLSGQN